MKVKRLITTLMSLMLLIGVLGGCATYTPNGYSNKRVGDGKHYYCYTHGYYGYSELGYHGGTQCEKKNSTQRYVSSQTNVINMDATSYQDNNRKSGDIVILKVPVWVNIRKVPYYPSQKRVLYLRNVYGGGQIQYLDSNWGSGNSVRSGSFGSTGYRSHTNN